MKKTIKNPVVTPNVTDNRTILIGAALIIILCIVFLCMGIYQTSVIGNETRIVKVKYLSMGNLVDNCGHPMQYDPHLDVRLFPVNISDVYELTITSYNNVHQYISYIKRVDKEKYIEEC